MRDRLSALCGLLVAVAVGLLIGSGLGRGGGTMLLATAVCVVTGVLAVNALSRFALPLGALAIGLLSSIRVIPLTVGMGARGLFLTDVVLPACAFLALRRRSPGRRTDQVVLLYFLAVLGMATIGVLNGAGGFEVLQDFRGPLYIVCGYLVASRLFSLDHLPLVAKATSFVLWLTSLLIAFSLATGTNPFRGRIEQTKAYVGGGSKVQLEAVRFLVAPKELAFVVVVIVVALLLRPRAHTPARPLVLGLLVPAAFVTFMAYSRQSVVGFLAALVFLGLIGAPWGLSGRRVARCVVGLLVLGGVLGATGLGARLSDPDRGVVGRQIEGFTERVIGGLTGSNAVDDPGNELRFEENEQAWAAFQTSPLVGKGLGTPYRPVRAVYEFNNPEYGIRYVHNVYLWYLTKGGVIGGLALLALLLRPVHVAVRSRRQDGNLAGGAVAVGAAFAGLLVIGYVEPVIHLNATGPVVGALLAYVAHLEGAALTGVTARSDEAAVSLR